MDTPTSKNIDAIITRPFYPGIDAVFTENGRQLRYDQCRPPAGADRLAVSLKFDGAEETMRRSRT